MTRLSQLLHLDDGEFAAARAVEEAKPTAAPPVPKPLGWGRAMLDHLAEEAPVAPRTLVMFRPAAQQPRPNQHAMAMASSAALHTVVTAYEDTADDLEILLATLAELTPFADAVKAGCSR